MSLYSCHTTLHYTVLYYNIFLCMIELHSEFFASKIPQHPAAQELTVPLQCFGKLTTCNLPWCHMPLLFAPPLVKYMEVLKPRL